MLIDSNILLEFFLDQERADECQKLLEKVEVGDIVCFISSFNVDGILIGLERKTGNLVLMQRFLNIVLLSVGFTFYSHVNSDILEAIKNMEKYGLDFEDSMTLQAAISTGSTEIISFDRHFDNIPGIKRIEPAEVV